jgi:hypothetical protein
MMMGLAIAHHIREQVVVTNEPIIVNQKHYFNIEKQMSPTQSAYGVGSKITVV